MVADWASALVRLAVFGVWETRLKRARLGIQASYLSTAPILSNSQKAIYIQIFVELGHGSRAKILL